MNNIVSPYIFYSVDIINSTAFKSLFINEWIKLFTLFYSEFPELLNKTCKEFNKHIPRFPNNAFDLPCPKVWKMNGDEILFFVNINETYDSIHLETLSHYEIVLYYTILFFICTEEYNKKACDNQTKKKSAFKIKTTGWFADVEKSKYQESKYGNIEVTDTNDKISYSKKDFIGRQIDIGFRLSKYSSESKFILSIEYLVLLLRDNYLTIEDAGIQLVYEGRKILKGILSEIGYPIVYMKMSNKFEDIENELLEERIKKANLVSIMRLAENYIQISNGVLYYPFINKDDRFFNKELREDAITTGLT